MNDTLLRIALLLIDTIIPISLGYILHKKGIVTQEGTKKVITFNVRVVFTVLAVISFWSLHIGPAIFWVPVIALVITFLPYFIMMAATKKNPDPRERGALVTAGMLGNTGTLGGLVCYLLLGPAAFAYVQIVAVIQNVLLITFNFPVAQKFHDMAVAGEGKAPMKKRSFAELFFTWNQVALIGMIVGAGLSLAHVPQPEWLQMVFKPLVHISAWIAFLPVGLLLDFEAARREMPKTLWLMPLKFILMPLVVWALCAAVVTNPVMAATLIIVSSCPTAINSVLTCALYRLKTNIAVSSFMTSTTVFALVMCPIYFFLFR